MKNEFREAYVNLFENSFTNLRRIIQVKLKAIRYSNKYLLSKEGNKQNYKVFGKMRESVLEKNIKRYNFEPVD